MEYSSSQVEILPPVQDILMNTIKECPPQVETTFDAQKDETIYNQKGVQIKENEAIYIPGDWVMSKLDQIKATSTLSVETTVHPDSINISQNVLTMNIKTYMDKEATMELHFFEDGIIKFNCANPTNPSQFSLEQIEKPANLTPYPLDGKVTIGADQVEVRMAEAQAEVVVTFNPFTVTLFSTRDNAQEVLFQMNGNSSLRFDENLVADFTFTTEHLYGLPERATNLLLKDTKTDLPYRLDNREVTDYPVRSAPIIMSRSKTSSTLVTMYWQNASETYIDVHKHNIDSSASAFWLSERGNLECYVFVSHDNKTHFKSLSHMFGHCAMPRYFSLGYHLGKWSHEDHQDILHMNEEFSEYEVPYDTITLDFGHTEEYNYFAWNKELFPNTSAMQEQLKQDGRQLITTSNTHIKVDERETKDQNTRPHVLSRSFYAGSQKYSTICTADASNTWEALKITVPKMLSLSLCGISNTGSDVGSFAEDSESELALRWYQLGTFMPYFRSHSALGMPIKEPWLYENKDAAILKESIKERYRLLPYLYTAFEEHCKTAIPLLRPVWFDQERVLEEANMQEQERFMFGDSLLVVPILDKGVTSIKGALKGLGGRWYDYFTKKEVFSDDEVKTGLERIGCFIKGGNIVPTFEIRSYFRSSQDAKDCNIHLYVALDDEENAKGKMYFDDGETFDYKQGSCMRGAFEFKQDVLTWTAQGSAAGYRANNRVTKAFISGSTDRFQSAYLEDGKKRLKVQLIKGAGYMLVEFVTLANRNWKIVFEE